MIADIKQCKTTGIKTVMITGNQALTTIAARLGMIEQGHQAVKTGTDLDNLSPADLHEIVKITSVNARVSQNRN